MCARLLACPLCSQPGFVTLDALRAGLVSVATRPLACPVCDETLLGIDKLTIHLFGHTISANDRTELRKRVVDYSDNDARAVDGAAMIYPHNWNIRGTPRTVMLPGERVGEKIPFARLAAAVNDKDDEPADRQRCSSRLSASSGANKTHGQMTFASTSNQQRQLSSPKIIHTDISISTTDTSNLRAYGAPVASLDGLPATNERLPSVVSAENSQEHDTAIYEKNFHEKFNTSAQKEETHFTDTWIENFLHQDGGKCFTKVSSREGKNEYAIEPEGVLSLPNGDEKYPSDASTRDVDEDVRQNEQPLNRLNSTESVVETPQEIFNRHSESSLNFKGLLPQWKAFRLVAMKEKTERCDICGIHFPDVNFLVLHKQLAHMISEKDVNAVPEELLKNCPCHLCTKVFKTRGTLMVHMRVAHMGYNLGFLSKDKESESLCCESGFNCPTCGKNFKKEQHVTQHLKTHEGKQWECDVCSKMFTTKYFLKKHKRLHSGEMPYKCTICDKTFTFQQSYHKHRLYHKDDKPHTCATCGRSFKELSTLHNHERIHTGEKPFVCETCGKCFRQRVSYLVHRRIHTGVMPYKCTVCGKSFRYKVSQRTHKCPAQPDETGPTVPETSMENSDLPSSCRVERSMIPKTDTFLQRNQSDVAAANENNKFILIVNTQGEPILTKETDATPGSSYLSVKRTSTEPLNRKSEDAHRNDGNDLWSNCLSRENVARESEKLPIGDANDFFSLVMSPMENDLSSPSTEMEHLRLSSPQNDDSKQNETRRQTCQTPNESSGLQRDLNNAIEGIFHDNCTVNSPLQTINEESLKQLLYGIDRKD